MSVQEGPVKEPLSLKAHWLQGNLVNEKTFEKGTLSVPMKGSVGEGHYVGKGHSVGEGLCR